MILTQRRQTSEIRVSAKGHFKYPPSASPDYAVAQAQIAGNRQVIRATLEHDLETALANIKKFGKLTVVCYVDWARHDQTHGKLHSKIHLSIQLKSNDLLDDRDRRGIVNDIASAFKKVYVPNVTINQASYAWTDRAGGVVK